MVVRRSIGVRRYVPAGGEDEEIGEGSSRIAGAGCEDAEDGRINVVDRDGTDVDELGQIVLVWDLRQGC